MMEPRKNLWKPDDYLALVIASTACLCLLILVLGMTVGILTGALQAEQLGTIKGLSVAGGPLGLALVLYRIIKVAIVRGKAK
ncbi:MAG: hypothetical protein GY847_40525 [Proteobacteria bacterium]|nr:hypothetical protein [Pseudomonadota bacterium]